MGAELTCSFDFKSILHEGWLNLADQHRSHTEATTTTSRFG